MLDRRTFLTGAIGSVSASLGGCLTVGGPSNERLNWSTSLGVSPNPGDARGLASADGTVAVVSADRLFGVSRAGDARWDALEHASGVFGMAGWFLAVDWPGFHPRNAVNEAVMKHVTTDGRTRWSSDPYALTGIAVGEDRFLVLHEGSSGMALSAASLADGTERWTVPLDGPVTSVRLAPDTVLTVEDEVVAHDAASGDPVWRAAAFERSWPPEVHGDRVVLASDEEPYRVRVFDLVDGRLVNEYEVGSGLVPSGPLAVHDGVAVGTGYDDGEERLFALDPSTGDVRWWTAPEDGAILSTSPRAGVAFDDGTMYHFDGRYVLRAVDLADGSVRWSFDAERNYPAVIATSDRVYVLAGGTLHSLSIDG